MAKKKKKRRPVKTEAIPEFHPDTGVRMEPYQILSRARRFHPELADARVLLYWNTSFTPDKDGRLTLARIRRLSDREREAMPYDACIEINKDCWHSEDFTTRDKEILLDHELCHLRAVLDDEGDPMKDTRDRLVYRNRKHDVEEFHEVVERHGPYDHALQQFARSLSARSAPPRESPPTVAPPASVTFHAKDRPIIAQVADELRKAGIQFEQNATVG